MITDQDIQSFHCWTDATPENIIGFLQASHRHIFRIKCGFSVENGDRDKEIFIYQSKIEDFLRHNYPEGPLPYTLNFRESSCEHIAENILNWFKDDGILWCEVLEDGRGGARISYE